MGALKVGDTVKMKYGGEAKVLAEFGSGGQGTVYKSWNCWQTYKDGKKGS